MRRNVSLLVAVSAVLALSLGGMVNAGIEKTRHNMSSGAPGVAGNTSALYSAVGSGTDEICIFCHTPHMGSVVKGDVLPLWNHRMSSSAVAYTMYKSASFNGADSYGTNMAVGLALPALPLDDNQLVTGNMAVTNLCLSCHDGTQAVNAMLNTPNRLGANPVMIGGVAKFGGKAIDPTSNAYLGTDLQNDHPVNFTYSVSSTVSDETLWAPTGTASVSPTSGTASAERVRLFNGTVQCATCHNPHQDYVTSPEFTPFLRVTISGSKLCLTCHNK